jgi:transcriptional regulator with XRE-family HTH domain
MTGQELRRIRKALGLSQAELASLVGVQPNSIARQERGEMGIKEALARLIQLVAKDPRAMQRTGMQPAKSKAGKGKRR